MKSRDLWLSLWLLSACGAAKLPPGLPPPEYEEPHAEPWPPAPASAAPAAAAAPPAAEPEPAAPAGPAGGSGGSGATLSPGTP
ncbi:MAG TPA: hypothetical protein VHB79_12610 [Polyangiaceae bacterium]|nr:hypothetical protein [Polyangiaceae bacterium]